MGLIYRGMGFIWIGLAVGCSGDDVPTAVAAAANAGSTSLAAAVPLAGVPTPVASTPASEPVGPAATKLDPKPATDAEPDALAPLPEMGALFAPPKVVVPVAEPEPEPEPEPVIVAAQPVLEQPKPVKPLPQVRLVGFVELEGLRALLSIEGKLNVVAPGDGPDGLQIVAIQPPAVTLKHGADGAEFQIDLYEQPWFHPVGSVGNGPVGVRPTASKSPPSPGRSPASPPLSTPPLPSAGGGISIPPALPAFSSMPPPPTAPEIAPGGPPPSFATPPLPPSR